MCSHRPSCPSADHRDHDAARTVAFHPEQGWSLLCNGVIVFDDMGEILPGGRVIPRTALPPSGCPSRRERENRRKTGSPPAQIARAAPEATGPRRQVKMIWPPAAMA